MKPIKNIKNLLKYIRVHGYHKAMRDWKKAYLSLETPEQLLKKEIYSYVGLIGAMLIAAVVLAWSGSWHISLVLVFSIGIAYTQLKGKLMQLNKLKEMMENFKVNGVEEK